MIRCLIDEDSFDTRKHPHKDLEQLSSQLELVAILLQENEVLDLPQDLVILVSCDQDVVPWDSPGQHCAALQTVYLSGIYKFKDLARYLSHELIHVEQTHKGYLTYRHVDNSLLWFGHPWQTGEDDLTYDQYRNLPWEVDAWRREPRVFAALKEILEDEQCLNDMVATRKEKLARGSLH